MTRPFDPPAPEGYEVQEADAESWTLLLRCPKCVALDNGGLCESLPCIPEERKDGRWVYFTRAVPAKDANDV